MIELPRRSVTRFFIPLVDVMTLLFCIFLLMPLVRGGDESSLTEELQARDEQIRRLEQERQRLDSQGEDLPRQVRDELEKLRRERLKVLEQRLTIHVLEIDPANGRLTYRDPDPVEVRNQADAQALIERDRKRRGDAPVDVYYLILFPRDRNSPYPFREQREQYERWFQEVAHGWDIPGAVTTRGGGT
jgi:cell division protein FtsB